MKRRTYKEGDRVLFEGVQKSTVTVCWGPGLYSIRFDDDGGVLCQSHKLERLPGLLDLATIEGL